MITYGTTYFRPESHAHESITKIYQCFFRKIEEESHMHHAHHQDQYMINMLIRNTLKHSNMRREKSNESRDRNINAHKKVEVRKEWETRMQRERALRGKKKMT
jgi:hypothetical protein